MQYALELHVFNGSAPDVPPPLVPLKVDGKSSFSEGANMLQALFFGKAMVQDVPGRRVRLGISLEYAHPAPDDDRPKFARGELKTRVLHALDIGPPLSIEELAELVGIRNGFTRELRQIVNMLVYQKILRRKEGKPVRFELKQKSTPPPR